MKWLALAAIMSLSLTTTSPGDLKIIKRERFNFNNYDCLKNASCTLKKIDFLIEDYRVEVGSNHNWGTRLFARYETDSVENLTDYVFAQYIKGCVFSSRSNGLNIHAARNYVQQKADGSYEPMDYLDWKLESFDDDPVYNSMPGYDRHHFYRWNKTQNSFDPATEFYFGLAKPVLPALYISDRPGTAFFSNGGAKNISLEFKMCIYRSDDVPASTPDGDIKSPPIYCFNWSSSWIYDHDSDSYTNPYGISEYCRK